jgi:hypothetical protein
MIRFFLLVLLMSSCSFVTPRARGEMVLLYAYRGAGVGGEVGDDDEIYRDNSGDFSAAFGDFSYAGGIYINEPHGFVSGFATHNSSIYPGSISMSSSVDINVSSGGGEFTFGSGGANSSLSATFRLTRPASFGLNLSGGGYPDYVQPSFLLQRIGGGFFTSYSSGDFQEVIILPSGDYVLSGDISAGAASYNFDPPSAALGSMSFSFSMLPVPEASSITLVLMASAAGLLRRGA